MLPNLSGAELAKSSWATLVESYPDVPDAYKSFFEPIFIKGCNFPYTVLTPSHERFIHRQTEKLICAFDDEITVLEKGGNAFKVFCYPIEGISYIEFRTALLASSFKICGKTRDGSYSASTLLFNSVTDYLFAPILRKARLGKLEATGALQGSEREQFEQLIKVNFKFMNYARHSLLGGEGVIHFILQPEIRAKILAAFGNTFYKTISPTHMAILTDLELVLIREEAVRRKEDKYGGIWDYIPLRKIKSLSVREQVANLLVLTVLLPENTCFELLFQSSVAGEIKQLVDQFGELTKV